ncbi:MAG: serine hydrolase [Elusimicrobiota bacterium]
MNRQGSWSSTPSPQKRSSSPRAAGVFRDRVLTALAWAPFKHIGIPAVFLLALAPALYSVFKRSTPAPRKAIVAGEEASPTADRADRPNPIRRLQVPKEDDPFYEPFTQMTVQIQRMAEEHPGQAGIYLKDLERGWEWTYHADDLFGSASLVKVPIMIAVFEKIQRGELYLSSNLSLRRRTRMGGSGSLKWRRDGAVFTVRKLLDTMIHESDNTAMRMLLDEIGLGFVQELLPRLGLVYTEIYPDGLTLASGYVRQENYTTAREMASMLENIYRGQVVDRFASELMLEIMKGHRTRARLARNLPVGWEIAHKTGLLRRACHDAAVIFSPYGDYLLVILTGRNQSYWTAKEFIMDVGRVTYRTYGSQSHDYAKAFGRPSQRSRSE